MKQIFFGVYKPAEDKLKIFRGQLAKHKELGGRDIEFLFYDVAGANLWTGV